MRPPRGGGGFRGRGDRGGRGGGGRFGGGRGGGGRFGGGGYRDEGPPSEVVGKMHSYSFPPFFLPPPPYLRD